MHPIAFINADGGYVTVVKADSGGDVSVEGLPVGSYGRKYTTDAAYDVDQADVLIDAGESVDALIPQAGVTTIYSLGVPDPGPVPAVSTWGAIVLALLVFVTGTLILRSLFEVTHLSR